MYERARMDLGYSLNTSATRQRSNIVCHRGRAGVAKRFSFQRRELARTNLKETRSGHMSDTCS